MPHRSCLNTTKGTQISRGNKEFIAVTSGRSRMKKLLAAVAVAAVFPASVMAAGENNIGSCGWGAKLFDGQSGIAPQVLGATTNGTFGNQTFGITFGTSGCTQDGAVKSSWKTALFIDGNKEQLARDMSVGSGETLDSL